MDTSNIDVPRGASLDSLHEQSRDRSRGFAPADLETVSVQSQPGGIGVMMELRGCLGIDKGDKLGVSLERHAG